MTRLFVSHLSNDSKGNYLISTPLTRSQKSSLVGPKTEAWSDSTSPQKETKGTHTEGMSGTRKGLRASLCHKEETKKPSFPRRQKGMKMATAVAASLGPSINDVHKVFGTPPPCPPITHLISTFCPQN